MATSDLIGGGNIEPRGLEDGGHDDLRRQLGAPRSSRWRSASPRSPPESYRCRRHQLFSGS